MDNQEIDLFKDWQKIAQDKFSSSKIKKQEIMDAIHNESNSTIFTLKKGLKTKIKWIIFFIILFTTWMLCSLNRPELLMIIGFLNISYIISLFLMVKQYKKMDSDLDYTGNTLGTMKKNLKLISTALQLERIWGFFNMPIAIIIGILISRHYKGFSILDTFSDPYYLTKIIVIMIIMLPLSLILTNKMNKSAFGKHTEKLKENIIRLELIQ